LKLAKLALDLEVKNLEAENKKYELGTDINQNVILDQNVKVSPMFNEHASIQLAFPRSSNSPAFFSAISASASRWL
jgi:hypothetical protein